jgi:hypothetical protein
LSDCRTAFIGGPPSAATEREREVRLARIESDEAFEDDRGEPVSPAAQVVIPDLGDGEEIFARALHVFT